MSPAISFPARLQQRIITLLITPRHPIAEYLSTMNSFICYLFGIYALPAKKHDPVILFRKLVRIQILVGSIDLVNLTK